MNPVKILVIPGSLRTGSHNVRLAGAAMAELVETGADVSLISLADYPLPIYDGDLEASSGVPTPAVNLKRLIGAHDGVLLVSPEYNSSPPPLLKNALDWVTRVRERGEPPGQALRG
ncbi:MAG: NAD(P)H-dependent oxidoreductase, partial [Xanthobacteraceae bacterium]